MGALDLWARLKMDGKHFDAGAKKAKKAAEGLKAKIGSSFKALGTQIAGALAVGALAAKAKETMDWAAQVRDLGKTYGISTDAIQQFQFAAQQSGTNIEEVMDAVKDLGKNTSEALEFGAENKIWAFKQFGIQVEKLKGMKPDEIFRAGRQEPERDGQYHHAGYVEGA